MSSVLAILGLLLIIGVPTSLLYVIIGQPIRGYTEKEVAAVVEPAIEAAFMDGFDYARRELS